MGCPIVRDKSGLALSSRNARLSEHHLKQASLLFRSLKQARVLYLDKDASTAEYHVNQLFSQAQEWTLDYFCICDEITLRQIDNKKTENVRIYRGPSRRDSLNRQPFFFINLNTFDAMLIEVVKSKIHRVRVTGADLDYIGSITLDPELIEAASLVIGEKVQVVNINNGERLETYVIAGDRGSGEVTLNGPAARKVQKGDIVIVIGYALLEIEEAKVFSCHYFS